MHRFALLTSFRWKLCLALALVFFGDWLFYQRGLFGGHVGLFALAMVLCLILGRPGVRRRWQTGMAALFALAYAAALVIDPGLLAWILFWAALGMAALAGATTPYDDGWLWFQRLLLHALRSPIAPMLDAIKLARLARRPRARRSGLRAALPVVALPLGGSAIFIALFASANPVIADILAMVALPDLSGILPARILLWLLLFALGWSVLRPRLARRLIPTFDGSGDRPIAGVSVASVRLSLILFNILFAIENALDIAYLSRALSLPEGTTMADYVHRGAYPLIVTALLAGLFVLVTLRPGSSTAAVPAIRRLVVLWIAQNVLLVATSMQRTLDYVELAMLTTLRIHALAWMALVAMGLLLICWRMLRQKSASWLINTNLAAATLVLTIFSFLDGGELAATWNVRHGGEVTGQRRGIDLCYIHNLGPSALLPLIELEGRTLSLPFRERVQWVRSDILAAMQYADANGSWTWRNEQRLRIARERLKAIRPIAVPPGMRDCDGTLVPPEPAPPSDPKPALTGGPKQ